MANVAFARLSDTLGVLAEVVLPNLAKGPIYRRDLGVRMGAVLDLDRRGVARMQALRRRYGEGPVVVAIGSRKHAVLLSVEDARRVLAETPEPFATDTLEKHGALAHLEPGNVLISRGPERTERRAWHEAALQSDCPVHDLADAVEQHVAQAAADLAARDRVDWPTFRMCWLAMTRGLLLGPSAAQDERLARELNALREDANWSVLKPVRKTARKRFLARVAAHAALAPPDSIVGRARGLPKGSATHIAAQIPQWLFAFDAAGITTLRALALLDAHREARARALADHGDQLRPFLRAAVLDAVRLYPTTPLILRETTTETPWPGATLPAGTGIVIYVPYFHRDGERLAFADRFAPEVWIEGESEALGFIPFSAGPAACPGRELVLLTASAMLERLVEAGASIEGAAIAPPRPLPATLDHTRLVIAFARRPGSCIVSRSSQR